MNAIIQVENLSATEIKAQRGELVAAITSDPGADLASRYVQARLDAKMRDERMAEQGKLISALQATVAERNDKIAEQERTVTALQAMVAERNEKVSSLEAELTDTVRTLQAAKKE